MNFTYEQEKQFLKHTVKESEFFLELDCLLNKYDWHFINPYIQVYKLRSLYKKATANELMQEDVSNFFIKEFYDLNLTLSYIDGYFKRSRFICPNLYFIEYSLILAFQKDYAGAINLLIPSIEASITNYFIYHRNTKVIEVGRYEKIRNAMDMIKEDILKNYSTKYQRRDFNRQQIKYLISLEREYLTNWFSIVNNFLKTSLFAHTSSNNKENTLNRHSILHLLEVKNYNSLENYIKLFNALKFICWIFLRLEDQSSFNEIDNETFIKKRLAYEDIICRSIQILPTKQIILESYELHNIVEYGYNISYHKLTKEMPLKIKILLNIKHKIDYMRIKMMFFLFNKK